MSIIQVTAVGRVAVEYCSGTETREGFVKWLSIQIGARRLVVEEGDIEDTRFEGDISEFLRLLADGLVMVEDLPDVVPARVILSSLPDYFSSVGADAMLGDLSHALQLGSFAEMHYSRSLSRMVGLATDRSEQDLRLTEVEQILRDAVANGVDLDIHTIRKGPFEFNCHPREQRTNGTWASWVRFRFGQQELRAEQRFGARGQGRSFQRALFKALADMLVAIPSVAPVLSYERLQYEIESTIQTLGPEFRLRDLTPYDLGYGFMSRLLLAVFTGAASVRGSKAWEGATLRDVAAGIGRRFSS